MRKIKIPIVRWSCSIAVAGLIPGGASAQQPADVETPPPVYERGGPLHRLFHHTGSTLQDKFIGYPNAFIEPPLGYYINEQFAVQVAKADTHRFTLYRSDFLPGTTQFSPIGASRFNLMFTRVGHWPGPIAIEWTPDEPNLAQARRQAVLATFARAGRAVEAARVVIGPSPYPGAMGVDAVNNFNNTLFRTGAAAANLVLPPTESAALGVR